MPVPRIDKLLGIDVYATETPGIGGVIRQSVDDFVVEEILVDGSKAKIERLARAKLWELRSLGKAICCVFWLSETGTRS